MALAALAGLAGLAACSGGGDSGGAGGGGSGAETACGQVVRLVEPGPAVHVVDAEVDYRYHPPASGPHSAGRPPEPGVYDEPVPEVEQVTALEVGLIVLQYDESVDGEAVARLEALAEERDDVVVTPAATEIDEGARVAFTAWERRQLCDAVSVVSARGFAADHARPR